LVTEKFQNLTEKLNKYSFIVDAKATKSEIATEVKRIYNVDVLGVNTMRYPRKRKVRYTKRNVQEGHSPAYKKAVVDLPTGQEIDFYSNV
jgi:large subunit ribosomal protein L23